MYIGARLPIVSRTRTSKSRFGTPFVLHDIQIDYGVTSNTIPQQPRSPVVVP
jgi:hypothetical protein